MSLVNSATGEVLAVESPGLLFRYASPTGLDLPAGIDFEEWMAVGEVLRSVEHSVMWWVGDWWAYGDHAYGDRAAQAVDSERWSFQTFADAGWVSRSIETSDRSEVLSWTHHRVLAPLDRSERLALMRDAEEKEWSVAELKSEVRRRRRADPVAVPPPEGQFSCIVIDPPWPMDKIEREVRPNQGPVLDYPVLTLDQIADDALVPVRAKAARDCHIYLWVTHRFMPAGLELLTEWGFNYQCVMTWRKNVGITPFSWMYDTEHVLFGRRGNLALNQLGLRLSFDAPVTRHSAKPDVFYQRVVEASPGPRLEMFARTQREGFTVWGNEVAA